MQHPLTRRAACAAISCALLLTPLSAAAQRGDKAEMLRLSAEGEAAYSKKQFREAAALFERAWQAMADPILRKNQTIAWYQVYNIEREASSPAASLREACANTIRFGELFINESNARGELNLDDQNLVHKMMVQCHQDMAQLELGEDKLDEADRHITGAAALGLKDERLKRNDELREQVARRRAMLAKRERPWEDVPQPERAPDGSAAAHEDAGAHTLWGWTLIGVGGAGLLAAGGATLYGISARDGFYEDHGQDADALEYNCDTSPKGRAACLADAASMEDSVGTSQLIMGIGLGVGLAAIIAGTVFLVTDDAGEQDATTRVLPTIGPDRAGVTVELRF